jgi:mannose-6-phosphate isomerase-like protein (cupin superfamily)
MVAAARFSPPAYWNARPKCGLAFLDLVTVPVGSTIGVHTHGDADEEICVVIGGSGRMSLELEEFAVGAGDVITNPPGGTHGLVNTGAGPLTLVVLDLAVSDQPGQTGRRGSIDEPPGPFRGRPQWGWSTSSWPSGPRGCPSSALRTPIPGSTSTTKPPGPGRWSWCERTAGRSSAGWTGRPPSPAPWCARRPAYSLSGW